jgi:hypothetical protein
VLPWYALLSGDLPVSLLTAMLIFGIVMGIAYVSTLLLELLNLITGIRLIVQGLALLFGLALGGTVLLGESMQALFRALLQVDPPAIFTFIFTTWMWWRGVTIDPINLHPQVIWQRFRLGLIFSLIYVTYVSWTGISEPELGWFMFFLFNGFLALVFARVSRISVRSTGKNPFDWRWLAGIVASLGLVLIVAAIFASLLTGQFSLWLDLFTQGIQWIVTALIFLLALPGMVIAGILGTFMTWLRSRLGNADVQFLEPQDQGFLYFLPETPPEPQPLSPQLQSLIFWIVISFVLIWIFWRLGRRMRRSRLPELGQPESLLEPGEARELLRRALQNTINDFAKRLRPEVRRLPAEQIRRIYIQLLDYYNDLGLPRPVNQTPLEYLPAMQSQLPIVAVELEEITQAYMRVRYGGASESVEEVERINAAWQRVVETGKQTR